MRDVVVDNRGDVLARPPMTATCHVCRAVGDANLCRTHTAELERALGDLPALAVDLQLVATRQAAGPLGLGDPRRQWDGPASDGALGDAPWEFAPGAADQLWAAANTVAVWSSHIAATLGVDAPKATRGTWSTIERWRLRVVRNRARWQSLRVWTPSPEQPFANVVLWLLGHVNDLRYDTEAGQAFDELTGLHADMTAAVLGARPPEAFYGLCDSPDVRFEAWLPRGPVCAGFGDCGHESCAVIRAGGDTQIVASTCGTQLWGDKDAREVTCSTCGQTYTRARRLASMLAQLEDSLGTISQVAAVLTTLGVDVTVKAIEGYVDRRRILARGKPKMVRVGDVLAERERVLKRRRKAA